MLDNATSKDSAFIDEHLMQQNQEKRSADSRRFCIVLFSPTTICIVFRVLTPSPSMIFLLTLSTPGLIVVRLRETPLGGDGEGGLTIATIRGDDALYRFSIFSSREHGLICFFHNVLLCDRARKCSRWQILVQLKNRSQNIVPNLVLVSIIG